MKIKRLLWTSALLLASALPLALVAVAPTSAYASGAEIHATMSLNCNNPSFCGSQGLGGFWGSAQFNSDGTASAQLIGCSHLQGGGPAAGAQHPRERCRRPQRAAGVVRRPERGYLGHQFDGHVHGKKRGPARHRV